ncbi:LLM class flavin-dependent oxidoreductase [Pseudonocardia endophytica]|uniref:Alkanesulfonate monooxygenase SsuD/methylene tetrahydromethanopterin reductase-like flavin-dependent oxidoreductase (Luciferase family) n=1 Tax=Pseudonocardia endophytica TaxID=401976 RepID=A0A4R1HX57_PSEEN|nr:LLM class flavin-dependent oxidoreductase [Pseudonocardia endophytica]TCK22122.1 alkanesulfonate monooxygenase SsuD/methylene tetrahydromethanopterin reductase-like flavin-dependent oxidoreductase (luciferase family) [Pseudonocardia endophytica]
MDRSTEHLVVGVEIDGDGAHPASWRAARHRPEDLLTPGRLAEVGRAAEAAGFGFLTLADAAAGPPGDGVAGRFDPVTAAAFLSAHTDAVGLVPVVATAHAEPFHVSNQLSSLDHGSRGRAGWLLDTGSTAARSAAYAVRHESDPEVLAAEAADVVDAARWLWDSWQDDAVVAEEATGRFLDADRVHHVDFRGRTFGVRGPALVPRPPQGQVVVLAPAGALPRGLVDVETVTSSTVDGLVGAAEAARAPRVLAEIEVGFDAELLASLGEWRPGERLRLVAPPDELVALLRHVAPHVDGVRLLPAVLDRDLPVLASDVLPALDLRRPDPGATLRDLLGLPRPAGRYAS